MSATGDGPRITHNPGLLSSQGQIAIVGIAAAALQSAFARIVDLLGEGGGRVLLAAVAGMKCDKTVQQERELP